MIGYSNDEKHDKMFEEQRKKVMQHFNGWFMAEIVDFLNELIQWNRTTARERAQHDNTSL